MNIYATYIYSVDFELIYKFQRVYFNEFNNIYI
jgi:hypothetical protein